jgi:tetratricopeptide (TPR) repeat protein
MGDTVNLAARVMGRAEWGQALATTAVTDRTRVDFHVEPIPPFMVKGKSEPISAAIVHEPRGTREIQTAETTRVVGREDELAQIDSAIDSAFQGSGRVVTIVGPPGIGKSKLVLEAMNKAEGMLRIRCDGGRYSLATPYFALRRPILAGLGLTMEASQGVVEATLREVVASVAPELLPLLPLLAGTVGIEIEDTPRTANLTGAERHEEVNRSLAHYIRRTLTGPSLIVIEDAHWVDTASAEVLTELCADLAGRPWAVVLTRRPEPGGFLAPEGGSATQIDLKPLGAEAALAMAAQELRGAHLKPGRLEELVERADGNPLFLRELVEAARGGALTELPDTVEKVIAANIDTLPATDRALLRHAAVLGNKFQREWLAGMLDQPLARTMTELKRLDHFLEFDAAGMARFQHVLLRDVAYEGLPFRTRRALHGKAGNLLELSEEDPDKISGLLSIHFHAAGRFDKAWRYSVVAARRSSRQGAPVEAAHFYERALDAAPGAAVEAAERGTVAESLGDAWETAGSYEQAASAFRIARRCALGGDPTGAAAVARKLAAVHDRAGNPTLAQSWLRRGIRELADVPSGAARRERAHLMANLGEMLNVRGHHTRAIPILRAAIELAESDGPSAALAFAYRALDLTYLTLGRPAEAVFSERALAVCTSLGDTAGVARSYNTMAMAARDAGSWVRAADLWSRAEEVTDELGDRVNAAVFAANIAEIWLDQGLVGQALPALVQVRELWEQAGWKEALGWVLGRLGLAHLLVGQPAEAAACFRESVALMEEVGIKLWLTEVRVSELQMALVQRDPGATARLAALRPEVESPAMAVRVDRLTAYGLAAGDRITEAIALVGQAIQLGREQGTEFETALCLEALARFQRRLGATGQADAHDAQKQQIFDRLGVVWTPDFPLGGGPQAGLVP